MSRGAPQFSDLVPRALSAVVMVVVGLGAIWFGGWVFLALLGAVSTIMLWELTTMLDKSLGNSKAILLALVGGAAVLRVGYDSQPLALTSLLLAPVVGLVLLRRDRALFLVYGAALLFAVASLFWIRQGAGLEWTVWLVTVVVSADIGGYLFGRLVGGPKILPRISPKKTWSGTLGGWFLAALVGVGFGYVSGLGAGIVVLSVVTAMASQCGDVAESAIKRHSGSKDSSTLIPGHGGFLDRFDALIAAALFAMLYALFFGLPMIEAL